MSNRAHTKNAPDAGQGVGGSDHSPNRQEGTTVMTSMHHTTDSSHSTRGSTLLLIGAPMRDGGSLLLLPSGGWGPEHDEPIPFTPTEPEPPAALAPVVSIDGHLARRRLRTVAGVAA